MILAMEGKVRGRYTDMKFVSDPVGLWKKIEEDRKVIITLDENYLQKQLFEVRLEESGTVANYLDTTESICANLATCDVMIQHSQRWFYIINGLRESWSVICRVIEGRLTKKELPQLVAKLLAKEACLKRQRGIGPDAALFTKWVHGKKPGGNQQRTLQTISASAHRETGRATSSSIECFYYRKKGRRRRDCPIRIADAKSGKDSSKESGTNTAAQASAKEEILWMAVADKEATLAEPVWVVDGECSNHVTGDRRAFISYTSYLPGEHQIWVADNKLLDAAGRGDIEIAMWKPG
jgi:hypothetical protein